jgi:antitoxin (DNA-binding transcriptional repressor) of toxin-antitoxin stability system
MTRATVRELHTKTNDIVNQVASGEVFVIEKEGIAIAEIRPITRPPTPKTDRSRII